jgi:DNA-binding NarL/FixJ family response regulator
VSTGRLESEPAVERAPSTPVRVLLAAGTFLLREGLRRVLEGADDVELLAVVGAEPGLFDTVALWNPDVVVIAASLPPAYDGEGIALAEWLRAERPDVGVVVLAESVEPEHVLRLVAGGVARRAYLLTDRIWRGEDVLGAVRSVAAGGAVVDPSVLERLAAGPSGRDPTRLDRLRSRERDVLGLLAEGCSNAAIADRLGVGKRAVEKHVSEVFLKLDLSGEADLSSRVAAALLYLEATGRLNA